MVAAQFLRNLVTGVPYAIHTVLTDNGIQFTNRRQDHYAFEHIFARVCRENGTEHRLTFDSPLCLRELHWPIRSREGKRVLIP